MVVELGVGYGVERGQDTEYGKYNYFSKLESETSEPLYDDGTEWTVKSFFFPPSYSSPLCLSIREICGWRVAVSGEGSKFLRCKLLVHLQGWYARYNKQKTHIQPFYDMPIKPINHYINCHLENDLILHIVSLDISWGT